MAGLSGKIEDEETYHQRRDTVKPKPKTKLGKRLRAIRKKIVKSGAKLLTLKQINEGTRP